DVGHVVRVIDGGGDVEGVLHGPAIVGAGSRTPVHSATPRAPAATYNSVASREGGRRVRGSRRVRRAALMALLAVAAPACTGTPSPSPTTSAREHPSPIPLGQHGLVFGAEGWPDCLNPIIDCGSTTWLQWTVLEHILPRAMQYD